MSVIAVVIVLLSSAPVWAHDTASSSFEVRPASSGLQVVFRLDGQSVKDMAGDRVLEYLDARFVVTKDGAPCVRDEPRAVAVDKLAMIDVVYRCLGQVTLESSLFHDEPIPHTLIGTYRGQRHFFTRGERTMTVEVEPPPLGGFRTATPPPGAFDPRSPAETGTSEGAVVAAVTLAIALSLIVLGVRWSMHAEGAGGRGRGHGLRRWWWR